MKPCLKKEEEEEEREEKEEGLLRHYLGFLHREVSYTGLLLSQ